MFATYWRCPSWNDLTIYLQNPFIKVNRKRVTWFPVEPLMMGTWLYVPHLPNACLQACPYWCCAPAHMPHSVTASRVIVHLLLLTSLHLFCAAMYSWKLWFGTASDLVCFQSFFFLIRKKICSYKGITKSWQHKGVKKVKVWGKKSQGYWCNWIKVGIKFHNLKLLSSPVQS